MSRINPSFFAAIIIIVIVGISIALPIVFFTEINKDAMVGEGWTPIPSETPTVTLIPIIPPTLTATAQRGPTPTTTSTPEGGTNCVYPYVYWEEHPELWLEMMVGNTLYSKDDIRLIFDNFSEEAYPTLLRQHYLANLNILSGADPTSIQGVLDEANIWLQSYSPDKQLPGAGRLIIVQLAQNLIDFNSGLIGPGFCSPYETLTVTPIILELPTTPTSTPTLTATSTATSVPTQLPTATATKTEKPDKPDKPEPTDPPQPTKEPDTPAPPEPTDAPTDAPIEEPTDAPTDAP